MRDDELDRILSMDEDLAASPGFARNVMAAVRREASAPPPIAFPWKRALPGLVLCVLSLVAMCVRAFLRPGSPRVEQAPDPSIWTGLWPDLSGLLHAANAFESGWIILALLLTFASVILSLRYTRYTGRRI